MAKLKKKYEYWFYFLPLIWTGNLTINGAAVDDGNINYTQSAVSAMLNNDEGWEIFSEHVVNHSQAAGIQYVLRREINKGVIK